MQSESRIRTSRQMECCKHSKQRERIQTALFAKRRKRLWRLLCTVCVVKMFGRGWWWVIGCQWCSGTRMNFGDEQLSMKGSSVSIKLNRFWWRGVSGPQFHVSFGTQLRISNFSLFAIGHAGQPSIGDQIRPMPSGRQKDRQTDNRAEGCPPWRREGGIWIGGGSARWCLCFLTERDEGVDDCFRHDLIYHQSDDTTLSCGNLWRWGWGCGTTTKR